MKNKLLILAMCFAFVMLQTESGKSSFIDASNGVRPAGMGDAFVSVADDANSGLFNPAGFASIESIQLLGMYSDLYSNLNMQIYDGRGDRLGYNFLSFVYPIPIIKGGFGVYWNQFTSILYQENVYAFSYAQRVWKAYQLDVGASFKILNWSIEKNETTTNTDNFPTTHKTVFSMDVGVKSKVWNELTLGFAGENLIPSNYALTVTENVPMVLRGGASYQFKFKDNEVIDSLLGSVEAVYRDELITVKAGVESWFFEKLIALRLGVNTEQLSAGLSSGFVIPSSPLRVSFDYAFSYPFAITQTLGSHRMGLTLKLGSYDKKNDEPVVERVEVDRRAFDFQMFQHFMEMYQKQQPVETEQHESRSVQTNVGSGSGGKIGETTGSFSVKATPTPAKPALRFPAANRERRIIIGVTNNMLRSFGDYSNVLRHLNDVKQLLQNQAAATIKIKEYPDKQMLVFDFQRGLIDLAITDSQTYKTLKSFKIAKPLVSPKVTGKTTFRKCIVVRDDSGIETVAQLEGKRIAYVNLNYFNTMEKKIFKNQGNYKNRNTYFKQVIHINSRDKALSALKLREVDAIIVTDYIQNVFNRQLRQDENAALFKLRFLEKVEEAAIPPILMRQTTFDYKISKITKIRELLLTLKQHREGQRFLKYFIMEDFVRF